MTREEFSVACREIRERSAAAAASVGRRPEDIAILAVTKFVEGEPLHWAQSEGFFDFGENYVQHLLAKKENFPQIRWHLIGHLQRNKVKSILGKVYLVQSLDNLALLRTLEEACKARGERLRALIQINIGEEPQKSGVLPADYPALRDAALQSDWVDLAGLMAVPPADDAEANKRRFDAMFEYSQALTAEKPDASILSMGMTHDFEDAIAHGSNMIRVGTALFGGRPAKGGIPHGEVQ